MRGLIIIIALLVSGPLAFAREQPLLARITVYWASGGKGSDHFTRQHKTATGLRLRSGHCAVDPRHIPYGSKVVFPDGSALAAVDTGTAVKNRKAARKAGRTVTEKNAIVIDRFFETKGQALAWANAHPLFMPVRVVPPNSRSAQQQPPASAIRYNATAPVMRAQVVAKYPVLAQPRCDRDQHAKEARPVDVDLGRCRNLGREFPVDREEMVIARVVGMVIGGETIFRPNFDVPLTSVSVNQHCPQRS